jgi:ABC-type multidrug transport system ATPase subunit
VSRLTLLCFIYISDTLAILGSSGAGKTSLMNALTLDADGGTLSGTMTLNGTPLSDKLLKQHAYVVRQEDPHWPYLTCLEALTYAAQLCSWVQRDEIEEMVESVVYKIGLEYCTNERCSRLTALEQRHLSIAIALLKQPTLLFLDEPTEGKIIW